MDQSSLRPGRTRSLGVAMLCAGLVLLLAAPAAGWSGAWTKPKRIFNASGAPTHRMVTDGAGKVHIAAEKGSTGIWYITNAGGSWEQCQVSSGNDRQPSIAVSEGVVHIAFARLTAGQKGLYTASSDQDGDGDGPCAWGLTMRHSGKVTHTSMAMYGASLSIAFRTADKKLRFTKGNPADASWTLTETIDSSCCTSAPDLALTHTGSPRVAYGDGTAKKAEGLKYAVRTSNGWKKSKASGGRVKQVAMALNLLPGLFGGPPSNAPIIAYVVHKQGLWHTSKSSSGPGGSWGRRFHGKYLTPPDITHYSNVTMTVFGKGGHLWMERATAMPFTSKLGGGGYGKPQLSHPGHLTFTKAKGQKGIYYSRAK